MRPVAEKMRWLEEPKIFVRRRLLILSGKISKLGPPLRVAVRHGPCTIATRALQADRQDAEANTYVPRNRGSTLRGFTMASAHRPRKKRENGTTVVRTNGQRIETTPFNLTEILSPGRKASPWVLLPLILIVAALFRWAVSFWGYSGQFAELASFDSR